MRRGFTRILGCIDLVDQIALATGAFSCISLVKQADATATGKPALMECYAVT